MEHTHTHIVNVDIPSREAWVWPIDTPNEFPHYTGTLSQCRAIAKLLNDRMSTMSDRDRRIPVTEQEVEQARRSA